MFFALSSISPSLQALSYYYLYIGLSIVLWIITAFILDINFFVKPKKHIFLIFCFYFYTLFVTILFGHVEFLKWNVGIAVTMFPILIYAFYKDRFEKFLNYIFWSIMVIVPIWCLISIKFLNQDSSIMRQISSNPESIILKQQGIGGYEFVYSVVFLVIICLAMLINLKRYSIILRILTITTMVMSLIVIVKADFSIATLTCFIGMLIVFVLKKVSISRILTLMIGLFCLLLLLENIFPLIIEKLSELTHGMAYAPRINEILTFISIGKAEGDLKSRIDLYILSINQMIQYPLLGNIVLNNIETYKSFGNHSTILDRGALYGLCIFLLDIYILLYLSFTRIKSRILGFSSLAISVFVSTVIIFTLNNATSSCGVMTFLMFPIAYNYINYNRNLN